MTGILVRRPGMQTTVQDLGRFGYQALGVPPAGAMDREALETANLLVGNPRGEAGLECVLTGVELECEGPFVFAVCGAPMDLRVNGVPARCYETLGAEAGDTISLGAAELGLCAYITFAGGLAVEPVMGSRSTYARGGFGGWGGRPLREGDRIPLREGAPRPGDVPALRIFEEFRPVFSPETTLHAIRVHESSRFDPESVRRFFAEPFIVTPKSDRMGCRLEGPRLVHKRGADILSSGVQTGTVQVPGDGSPIVLRVDRQTTGGYTRIAQVIQADLSKLGQLRPGGRLRFVETTVEAAQKAWRDKEAGIAGSIARADGPPRRASASEVQLGEERRFNVIVDGTEYVVTVEEIVSASKL
jgi:biotin-dependent carboxylase-like uncharacterized protein